MILNNNATGVVKSPTSKVMGIKDDQNGKAPISRAASLLLNQQQQQRQRNNIHEKPDQDEEESLRTNGDQENKDFVNSEGVVHRIGPIPYRDGLTVADLCDVCNVFAAVPLRPHKNDEDESGTSAPFFTAVEMNGRGRRLNRSSFCELL